eukprot:152157-Amphidinium_carterae.1
MSHGAHNKRVPLSGHDKYQLEDAVWSIKTSFKVLAASNAKLDHQLAQQRTKLVTHFLHARSSKQ